MSVPTSPRAYDDCYELLDKALESPNGIRVRRSSWDVCNHYRMRLHQARKIDRQKNAMTYEPDHAMHNASQYDSIAVRIREAGGMWYLYIEPNPSLLDAVEILDGPTLVEAPPEQLQIEAPPAQKALPSPWRR